MYYDSIADGYDSLHREEQQKKLEIIKGNLDIRRSRIKGQLTEQDQDKDEILKIIDNILIKEKNIYGKILKIFNGEDKNLILDMQDDLQDLTDQFGLHLTKEENTIHAVAPDIEARIKEMEKKNNVLNTENDRLKEDLKKAMETIDNIQAEYEQLYQKAKDLENK